VLHEGRAERVRLWSIDAPKSGQLWRTRAKQFTGDLGFGKVVIVRVCDIDRYKRTVAELILPDGRNLNQELLRAGIAWRYRQHMLVRQWIS
jgi:micrococcal nuclease